MNYIENRVYLFKLIYNFLNLQNLIMNDNKTNELLKEYCLFYFYYFLFNYKLFIFFN